MFGFQTLACLHDIPVIRSSTSKIQDVYNKAKETSPLIRLPCHLAESVADTSLKIARTVADPLVKPLRGPVNAIDGYAAQKFRQLEAKYPLLTTPTEEVLNTFNEKTEPVRCAMNSVKDTTTSTIQQGKETVSHVASVTVNKATDVADTVYTFCETHVPGKTHSVPRDDFARRTTLLWERIRSTVASLRDHGWQAFQSLLLWFRMFLVLMLLRIKQFNDQLLNHSARRGLLTIVFHRIFVLIGTTLEYVVHRLRPDDRTLVEMTKTKQQPQPQPQPQTRVAPNKRPQTPQFVSRPTLKPDAFVTTQSVVVTSQETTVTGISSTDRTNLYPRIPVFPTNESGVNDDIKNLYEKVKPSDMELLFSRLPADIVDRLDRGEPLTEEQRSLHAKIIGAELERQGYREE